MQIEITGQNVDVTQALRAYITEKCERFERHFDNLISAHFVLRLEKVQHMVEATIAVGGRTNPIFAEVHDENMYAAIDALADKLDRQVRRHKQKVTDHHRSASRAAEAG
ncbi:ribosome hibernation-promoting factor, HPF/YfiA family [Wenzhouxiangella marina]|uniref:Ribosome hibernation promoting factor n=1 Tax=Wenzhouxiangella marina TaxID=1579979 RepID=A0A0K0XYU5_9GAMM|nr:ribosome-associated translation inhibitor RaiA [Wenzhouxiangella marina]AKS42796.1 ribosome hibernation promoting factor HPF [Wenzhouxiangella marina]MBB6087526.1 putative sigma-54 modulation protein [Wenzhouxiangella marina]